MHGSGTLRKQVLILMDDSWIWYRDQLPSVPGWYATRECWDVEEGIFPNAHYWDGKEWVSIYNSGITYWKTPFDSEEEALKFSQEHDPEEESNVGS